MTPAHKVGDTYTTETLDQYGTPLYRVERKVISSTRDKIIVESRNPNSKKNYIRTLEYTPEWNLIRSRDPDGGGFDYSPILKYFEFPLAPGKQWTQRTRENNLKTGAVRYHTIKARVGDLETVTVPAGTFNALKIMAITEILDEATGEKTTGTDTSWFSPDVGKTVLTESTSTRSDGTESSQIIKLIKFTKNSLLDSSSGNNELATRKNSDSDILKPIDNIFKAWKNLDYGLYADQWSTDAVQYSKGRKTSINEILAKRKRTFGNVEKADVISYSPGILDRSNNTASVEVSYSITYYMKNGKIVRDDDIKERYNLAYIASKNKWIITQNNDYIE